MCKSSSIIVNCYIWETDKKIDSSSDKKEQRACDALGPAVCDNQTDKLNMLSYFLLANLSWTIKQDQLQLSVF